MPRPLNARQKKFILEYLKDANATQAAIRAGYSPRSAGQTSHKMLKQPEIAAAVRAKSDTIVDRVGLSVEECYGILAREARDAESSRDRIAAVTTLLKLQHKVAEKVEQSGTISIAVVNPYAYPVSGDGS